MGGNTWIRQENTSLEMEADKYKKKTKPGREGRSLRGPLVAVIMVSSDKPSQWLPQDCVEAAGTPPPSATVGCLLATLPSSRASWNSSPLQLSALGRGTPLLYHFQLWVLEQPSFTTSSRGSWNNPSLPLPAVGPETTLLYPFQPWVLKQTFFTTSSRGSWNNPPIPLAAQPWILNEPFFTPSSPRS